MAIVLPLTLAWKLAARADDTGYLQGNIIGFLARHNIEADATDDVIDNFPVIRASNGACRMQIMKASYYGADRDTVRDLMAAGDSLTFVYRGKVYAEQPIWSIVSDQIWMRLLLSMGLADHLPQVLAVAAPVHCNVDKLPWEQLK